VFSVSVENTGLNFPASSLESTLMKRLGSVDCKWLSVAEKLELWRIRSPKRKMRQKDCRILVWMIT
jgi:hypothetical protein